MQFLTDLFVGAQGWLFDSFMQPLLFALGLLLAGSSTGFSLEFDVTLRPVLLLSFFAAVGLSASLGIVALIGLGSVKTRWRTTWGAAHIAGARV